MNMSKLKVNPNEVVERIKIKNKEEKKEDAKGKDQSA